MPDLDPEPIPNIVLYPGDTIVTDADDATRHVPASFSLRNRDGHTYAVLDVTYQGDHSHAWRIDAIRADRRGMLPVRSDSDPKPEPYGEPHAQPNDDPNLYLGGVNVAPTHPDARPINLILSNFGRVTAVPRDTDTSGDLTESESAPLSSLTSTHSHPHTHPGAGVTDPNAHDHEHTHTGAVALSHGKPNYAYDHQHDES